MRTDGTIAALVVISACTISCVGYHEDPTPTPSVPEDTHSAEDAVTGAGENEAATGEASDEISWFKTSRCTKQERGVDCMIRCNKDNMACRAGERHPHAPGLGLGKLYQCKQATAITSCWNVYSNGEICVFALGSNYCRMEGSSI